MYTFLFFYEGVQCFIVVMKSMSSLATKKTNGLEVKKQNWTDFKYTAQIDRLQVGTKLKLNSLTGVSLGEWADIHTNKKLQKSKK